MINFLRKIEHHGIKIALFNSVRITKSINLFSFCTVLGSVVIEGDFSLQSIYRDGNDIYIYIYIYIYRICDIFDEVWVITKFAYIFNLTYSNLT